MKPFNPLDFPICTAFPERLGPSRWIEHIPFAFSLVDLVRPGVVVELGTTDGVSYCAFCQAISQLGLGTRACGIVTSPPGREASDDSLEELKTHHDPIYGSFSRLIRNTLDEALGHFADASIDILHIDWLQGGEWRSSEVGGWLPKVKPGGVILFSGLNLHEADRDAGKFWRDIKSRRESFEFTHEGGLGVAAFEASSTEPLRAFLRTPSEEAGKIRAFYCRLGQGLSSQWERRELHADARAHADHLTTQHAAHVVSLERSHFLQFQELRAAQALENAERHGYHLRQMEKQHDAHAATLLDLRNAQAKMRRRLAETEQRSHLLHAQLQEKIEVIEAFRSQAAEAKERSDLIQVQLQEKTAQAAEAGLLLAELQEKTAQAAEPVRRGEQHADPLQAQIVEKTTLIDRLRSQAAEAERRYHESEGREHLLQAQLQAQAEERTALVAGFRLRASEQDRTLRDLHHQFEDRVRDLNHQFENAARDVNHQVENRVHDLNHQFEDRARAMDAQLSGIHRSIAFRLACRLSRGYRWFAPPDSRRARLFHLMRRSGSVLRREGVGAFVRKASRKVARRIIAFARPSPA